MRKKVTVVGAGNVGASCAVQSGQRSWPTSSWWMFIEGIPRARRWTCSSPARWWEWTSRVTGANDYAATANSDIVIFTAGFPRKPGMSRDDLLWANYDIVKATVEQAVKYSPEQHPDRGHQPAGCDVPRGLRGERLPEAPRHRHGGILDTARFRTFIARS